MSLNSEIGGFALLKVESETQQPKELILIIITTTRTMEETNIREDAKKPIMRFLSPLFEFEYNDSIDRRKPVKRNTLVFEF